MHDAASRGATLVFLARYWGLFTGLVAGLVGLLVGWIAFPAKGQFAQGLAILVGMFYAGVSLAVMLALGVGVSWLVMRRVPEQRGAMRIQIGVFGALLSLPAGVAVYYLLEGILWS